jgi:hypothetical protein
LCAVSVDAARISLLGFFVFPAVVFALALLPDCQSTVDQPGVAVCEGRLRKRLYAAAIDGLVVIMCGILSFAKMSSERASVKVDRTNCGRAGGRARIPTRVDAPRSVSSDFPQSDETKPPYAVPPADGTHTRGMTGQDVTPPDARIGDGGRQLRELRRYVRHLPVAPACRQACLCPIRDASDFCGSTPRMPRANGANDPRRAR